MATVRDEIYHFSCVTFEVEGTLFRVPRKEFEEQSVVFKSMFSLPLGDSANPDGHNDERPIRLEGVVCDDFRTFLRALYPRYTMINIPLTEKELEMALTLARMWCFDELRAVLVDKLASIGLTSSRKLELARIHDIRSWYRPELNILARRSDALTEEEIQQIGMDLTFMVLRLKERRLIVALNSSLSGKRWNDIEYLNGEKLKAELDSLMDEFAKAHRWDVKGGD